MYCDCHFEKSHAIPQIHCLNCIPMMSKVVSRRRWPAAGMTKDSGNRYGYNCYKKIKPNWVQTINLWKMTTAAAVAANVTATDTATSTFPAVLLLLLLLLLSLVMLLLLTLLLLVLLQPLLLLLLHNKHLLLYSLPDDGIPLKLVWTDFRPNMIQNFNSYLIREHSPYPLQTLTDK